MNGFVTRQEFDQLRGHVRGLEVQIERGRARIQRAEDRLLSGRAIRQTTTLTPLLALGIPQDVTFVWRQPMPSDDYFLEPSWPIPSGVLFSVKDKAPQGAIVTLTAQGVALNNLSITLIAWC